MVQKIKRAQLLAAHGKFDCRWWKESIESILMENPLALEEDLIEIKVRYIKELVSYGTEEQELYAESLGIILPGTVEKAKERIEKIFRRLKHSKLKARTKKGKIVFEFKFKKRPNDNNIFYYSYSYFKKKFFPELEYSHPKLSEIIQKSILEGANREFCVLEKYDVNFG